MEYITDLSFIKPGVQFPLVVMHERLKNYSKNKHFYIGDYIRDSLEVKTAQGKKTLDWKIPKKNYFKLTTDKTVSLLTTEPPTPSSYNPDVKERVEKIWNKNNFVGLIRDLGTSLDSLGDAVLFMEGSGSNVFINAVSPKHVIKVVSPTNMNTVRCYVLWQVIYTQDYDSVVYESKITQIRFLIHYKGYYIEQFYAYDGNRIGQPITVGKCKAGNTKKIKTGFKDFAVIFGSNSRPLDGVYGVSNYKQIEDSVLLLEKKTAEFDLITDKHSDPIFQTSRATSKVNEKTGEREFDVFGNIIFPKKDDVESKYITWDGNLGNLETFIDKQKEDIALFSEFGSVFLSGDFGANATGETIRMMAHSVLAKTSRLIDVLDYMLKTALINALSYEGLSIDFSEVSITWQDGLPNTSELTQAQTIQLKKQAGILSTRRALSEYEGLSEEEIEKEIENIKDEGVILNDNMGEVKELVN